MIEFDLDNPFSVTKATEFNDIQINDYWVDFNFEDKESVIGLLNPSEYLPKYILGGKGCGKTHILRYFSYPLQKIRSKNDYNKIIENDKYLGIYSVLEGINSSRFSGKGVSNDEWQSVFEYYFELYLSTNLLSVIQDFFAGANYSKEVEKSIINKVLKLFYVEHDSTKYSTFDDLLKYFNELRRKVDSEIVNAAFKRKLDYDSVKILFSPGELIFGIPQAIIQEVQAFTELKFIFILDEYEKLFEWQKIFINTLVWDKKMPATFWVGARKYGYTTTLTKSGEEMKAGSEFQPIDLDLVIRKNEDLYKKFAKELFLNRLKKFFEKRGQILTTDEIEKKFEKKFQVYSDDILINEIKAKCKNENYKHKKELAKKIKDAIVKGYSVGISETGISSLINSLFDQTEGNPLEQKFKLFLFYQLWNTNKDTANLNELLSIVNTEYNKGVNGENSEFDNIKEKFKRDFIAQLASENDVKNVCYSGLHEFIELSWGNPRAFILILKKIIELAKLRGEKPLEDGSVITLETQFLAVYGTSRWFYEDAEVIGESGKNFYKSINSLSEILRVYRFSDKPTETSVSSFNVAIEDLSESCIKSIELAKTHSFIIEIEEGRKGKNSSGRIQKLYQLNKILAPLWNLPTSRRGSLNLTKDLAEAIFNPSSFPNFDKNFKDIKNRLNAPSFGRTKGNNDSSNLVQKIF
ncbi:hypothetical protein CAP35_06590 [Chitinophagaceae bacterium IBVUCB1]|nr:hypothetical protein CAP35_06590 [Chitinophagaceae bacterium IBVUCB1]